MLHLKAIHLHVSCKMTCDFRWDGGGGSKITWYILLQSAKGTGLSSKKESPGVIFQFVQHMHARAWCLYTTYVTDIIAITLSNLQDAACGVISYVFYFRTTHVNKTSCLLQQYVQDRPKHVQNFLLGGGGWVVHGSKPNFGHFTLW